MGHSQFAEYIGARGPNTQVNAACATTTQAIALAEDWIRSGRCRRVLVIAGDDVTGDSLMEWVGAGFLALGAAATDDRVSEAALPFDRRRHGTILGMGACALVVESEDALRERGMRGIVELLSTEAANSAYHGSRLDVDHIGDVMEGLVSTAEKRFGVNRYAIAPYTVFVSHETYTPARGGSAAAEVVALRKTFGEAARHIVVSNTKGFTGHAMGVGVEDVLAVKMLEYGIVPPVPNFQEVDPDLGVLNLSRGGNYPIAYALHLAAGFGSQVSMTLLRRVPGGPDRVEDRLRYQHWLDAVSGYDRAQLETVQRVLRVQSEDGPGRSPQPSQWRRGQGPCERAAAPGEGIPGAVRPAPLWKVADKLGGEAGKTVTTGRVEHEGTKVAVRDEAKEMAREHTQAVEVTEREGVAKRSFVDPTGASSRALYASGVLGGRTRRGHGQGAGDRGGQDRLSAGHARPRPGPGGRPGHRHGKAGRDLCRHSPGV